MYVLNYFNWFPVISSWDDIRSFRIYGHLSNWGVDDGAGAAPGGARSRQLPVRSHPVVEGGRGGRRLGAVALPRRRRRHDEHHGLLRVQPQPAVLEPMGSLLLLLKLLLGPNSIEKLVLLEFWLWKTGAQFNWILKTLLNIFIEFYRVSHSTAKLNIKVNRVFNIQLN